MALIQGVRPSAMVAPAVLSCLGIQGWGPLHLLLPDRGDPGELLQRLQQASWAAGEPIGAARLPAGCLLANLLRSQSDLQPLTTASAAMVPLPLLYRHRLVCPPGEQRLRLRSWRYVAAEGRWLACGRERWLDSMTLQAARQGATAPASIAFPGCPALSRSAGHCTV